MEENIKTAPIKPSFGKDLPGFGSHFGRPVSFLPPKIRITEPKVIIVVMMMILQAPNFPPRKYWAKNCSSARSVWQIAPWKCTRGD